MNEQEFLKAVHMKINVLQHERDMLEMIQQKQKKHLYKKIRTCSILLSTVLALIIYTVLFSIELEFLMFASIVLVMISIWFEISDFEAKDREMGVKDNGYSYK